MVQKEKQSLWRIKHLLTRLSGDSTWIPCESVETENDFSLFIDERDRHAGNILAKAVSREEGDQVSTGTLVSEEAEQPVGLLAMDTHSANDGQAAGNQIVEVPVADEDVIMTSSADLTGAVPKEMPETLPESLKSKDARSDAVLEHNSGNPAGDALVEGAMELDTTRKTSPDDAHENPVGAMEELDGAEGDTEDQEGIPAPHRMRTRAQAQAASDNTVMSRTRSMTPDSTNDTSVDPYFLAPRASRGDRNVGLPQHEAEETRRLLQLYIQKQEEVCRGAQRIYEGLLKADRYRKLVMKWAKAEGHVGVNRDMSDGEDWYDKEEWGLDEDLKKGQDEEEEDAATTAKKTRTRRQ
jgi:hypothetical protein